MQELAVYAQPALLQCAVSAAQKNMNVPSGFVQTALDIQWKLLLDQFLADGSFSTATPAVIGALAQTTRIVESMLGDEKVVILRYIWSDIDNLGHMDKSSPKS